MSETVRLRPPAYFETIRHRAEQRWQQLEADPDLAAPWHQLFKQVQSPRHVLSELLQNADDAGASEASAEIKDGAFVFRHNGEDFAPEHFESLCRFGYSNKRALHTIGFRGIGFKSTFSLGDRVELRTPTLAVAFDRERFTRPIWLGGDHSGAQTEVRVELTDERRERELRRSFDDWLASPLSLLFFNNIRRLHVAGQEIAWKRLAAGPVPSSHWVTRDATDERPVLLISSAEEPFPTDALEELRQERMVADGDMTFPPCRVEIVVGAEGRLHVVLPTGVQTGLPFACNAPFVQDPARLKIKEPEASPTNRWLLRRIGRLAAESLLQWLRNDALDIELRAAAYDVLPDVDRGATSLAGSIAAHVENACAEALGDEAVVLTETGDLADDGQCISIPGELRDIWQPEQVSRLFDERGRPALNRNVNAASERKLQSWQLIERLDKAKVVNRLAAVHPPKPKSWRQLLLLWSYVRPEVTQYYLGRKDLRIVPAQGSDVLHAAEEVVRLGKRKLLNSDEDWAFLASQLLVLNPNWTRFLADERREVFGDAAVADDDEEVSVPRFVPMLRRSGHVGSDTRAAAIESADAVLDALGLRQPSSVDAVVAGVASRFFPSKEGVPVEDCIRFAEICAKLGASPGANFRFINRAGVQRSADSLIADPDGAIEQLLPLRWRTDRLLHQQYGANPRSCTRAEWFDWLRSGKSGLQAFVPFTDTTVRFYGRQSLLAELGRRRFTGDLTYPYTPESFQIDDFTFESEAWDYWIERSNDEHEFWAALVRQLLRAPQAHWLQSASARVFQVATTGRRARMTYAPVAATWVTILRDVPCLPDTFGKASLPGDLLRRTPETEALLDVEPFVHASIDTEANRPLLDLLGVRSSPTGPDGILARLRALAKAPKPPINEVEKWYRRLDQVLAGVSTEDIAAVRRAFHQERLIWSSGGCWATSSEVFVTANEIDVPGALTLPPTIADLQFWRRIGVAERPSADLALAWIKSLPGYQTLADDELRRVRAVMQRYPGRVWHELGRWLDLDGRLAPCTEFRYSISPRSPIRSTDLLAHIKQATADLTMLDREVIETRPFSTLPLLSTLLEERPQTGIVNAGRTLRRHWLTRFASLVSRVIRDTPEATARTRMLAQRLARTQLHNVDKLEAVPYLEGTPIGTPRSVDAIWFKETLFVAKGRPARIATAVIREISRAFEGADIESALQMCFERPDEFIEDYFAENFHLESGDVEPESRASSANKAEDALPVEQDQQTPMPTAGGLSSSEVPLSLDAGDPIPPNVELLSPAGPAKSEPKRPPAPQRPPLIERFALSRGFQKDGTDRFFHRDGSWISKVAGETFPWQHCAANGEVVRQYWPREHCLDLGPLEVDAEVWSLCTQAPTRYALLLTDEEDRPKVIPGMELKRMKDEGSIELFAAKYRIARRRTWGRHDAQHSAAPDSRGGPTTEEA